MASREERVVGVWWRERKVFSKAETEVKSQIVFHILSVGHVVVLCSRKHFQIFYSINKSFISVSLETLPFCVCK